MGRLASLGTSGLPPRDAPRLEQLRHIRRVMYIRRGLPMIVAGSGLCAVGLSSPLDWTVPLPFDLWWLFGFAILNVQIDRERRRTMERPPRRTIAPTGRLRALRHEIFGTPPAPEAPTLQRLRYNRRLYLGFLLPVVVTVAPSVIFYPSPFDSLMPFSFGGGWLLGFLAVSLRIRQERDRASRPERRTSNAP